MTKGFCSHANGLCLTGAGASHCQMLCCVHQLANSQGKEGLNSSGPCQEGMCKAKNSMRGQQIVPARRHTNDDIVHTFG